MKDEKTFEDLYYKENAEKELLKQEVKYLKEKITYLKAYASYIDKYGEKEDLFKF